MPNTDWKLLSDSGGMNSHNSTSGVFSLDSQIQDIDVGGFALRAFCRRLTCGDGKVFAQAT